MCFYNIIAVSVSCGSVSLFRVFLIIFVRVVDLHVYVLFILYSRVLQSSVPTYYPASIFDIWYVSILLMLNLENEALAPLLSARLSKVQHAASRRSRF